MDKKRQLRAVIFDMDGTLLDTERAHLEAWKRVGKAHGYDISEALFQKTRGLSKAASRQVFKVAYGEDFDYDAMRPERHAMEEAIIARRSPMLLPGVGDFLKWLRSRDMAIAVASSTRREYVALHLEQSEITEYFDAVVGGDMVEKGKPDPEIFLLAAKLLGIAPEHCLVVEDAPSGATAGLRAGMMTVLVPDLVPVTEEIGKTVDFVANTMADLPAFLEENAVLPDKK